MERLINWCICALISLANCPIRYNLPHFYLNCLKKPIFLSKFVADKNDLMIEMLRVFHLSPGTIEKRSLTEEEALELRQIFFAIGLVFLLLSYRPDEETSISIYHRYNHPHPCVRMVNVFDVLTNYISSSYSIDMSSVCNTMSDALSMLISIGHIVGVDEFDIIQTNLNEIENEIASLQDSIGQSWRNHTNQVLTKAIIDIRKSIPLV